MSLALLAQLSEALGQRRIPHRVIGGQAVLAYSEPRFAQDIDMALGAGLDRLGEILELVEENHWKALAAEEFVRENMVFPCQDPGSGIRMNLVFSTSPYALEAMGRARRISFNGHEIPFSSPEDLVIQLVLTGRDADLDDALLVQIKTKGIDLVYIEKWLRFFETALGRPMVKTWKCL
jgi:hypothetical protein